METHVMKHYLFYIIILTVFTISCSFPNKTFTETSNNVSKYLDKISILLRKELSQNTSNLDIYKLKDPELKSLLNSLGIQSIGIHYKSGINTSTSINTLPNNFEFSFDSTITLTWTKVKKDKLISDNLIYFFSKKPSNCKVMNNNKIKQKQINDSVCLQRILTQLIVTQ